MYIHSNGHDLCFVDTNIMKISSIRAPDKYRNNGKCNGCFVVVAAAAGVVPKHILWILDSKQSPVEIRKLSHIIP